MQWQKACPNSHVPAVSRAPDQTVTHAMAVSHPLFEGGRMQQASMRVVTAPVFTRASL